MNKFGLVGFGLVVLVSTVAFAEPSRNYASLAEAVQEVKANCRGDIHDANSTSFLYPPEQEATLTQCQSLNGDLCWARDQAMGGRWSRELICTEGSLSVGGFPNTYTQGQNQ